MTRESVNYERLGLVTMKAQRFAPGLKQFGAEGQYCVGGHVRMTTLTAGGVTSEIVHAWPEDRVGEKIRPRPRLDPIAHPNVTPIADMNRADRRRAAKASGRVMA